MRKSFKNVEQAFEYVDRLFSCRGKVKYGGRETAINAVKRMKAKGVTGLEEYKCRHCHAYHIGHGVNVQPSKASVSFKQVQK